jgi:uncharacterized protein
MTDPIDSTDDDIDRLEELCERLAGFDDEMSLEWLDGTLAAVLVGPRTVTPNEWVERMIGDSFGRAFADPQDVAQAMAVLMRRWDVVAAQLEPQALSDEPDQLRLTPLIMNLTPEMIAEIQAAQPPDAPALEFPRPGEVWATGFLDAVDAFEDDWRNPEPGTETGDWFEFSLQCVEILTADEDTVQLFLEAEHDGVAVDRDALVDGACFAVQDLRLFWLEQAVKTPPRRVEPGPGRNDPCPCGSGKKFKRCHGDPARLP